MSPSEIKPPHHHIQLKFFGKIFGAFCTILRFQKNNKNKQKALGKF